RNQPAEILAKWQRGTTPTTLGVLSIILFALRRGSEQALPEIARFLATRFRPRFADLLRTRKVDATLEVIRTRFRNPADHAERVFNVVAYGEFARLVLANHRFALWDIDGPDPSDPDAGSGILYHHLHNALDTAADDHARKKEAIPGEGKIKDPEGPMATWSVTHLRSSTARSMSGPCRGPQLALGFGIVTTR